MNDQNYIDDEDDGYFNLGGEKCDIDLDYNSN